VYTILASNCHEAARYTSITRQSVQQYITRINIARPASSCKTAIEN